MQRVSLASTDAFSLAEIASAAGVDEREVRALHERGLFRAREGFADSTEAIKAVRLLRALAGPTGASPRFETVSRPGVGTAGSMALHACILGGLLVWGALRPSAAVPAGPERSEAVRLVFLSLPGPGGGGGGGGNRQSQPPARARLRDTTPLKSPVVAAVAPHSRPPAPDPARVPVVGSEPEPEPTPPDPPAAPPVVAPVAAASADEQTTPGTVSTDAPQPSQGPGTGGGSGTGEGRGLGEGSGPGIGPGAGGGTGGGPYRPGSGITPPALLHEVRPDYTEEARRRGISGEVVLEIVVRSDGRVGAVRVRQALGAGLDQRAIDAVREWRFSPARRFGSPVDVLVEVAVEFRLR